VKEKVRMQFLAGLITESQYKQLLEDETTLNRILDKMSDQGKDSLTPEEKAYLDNYSKGKKDLEAPIHYIKLNLPKDINSDKIIPFASSDFKNNKKIFEDLVNELIQLNPQINPELLSKDPDLYEDVADNIKQGTKKEILSFYFYWLFRNLTANYFKFSDKEVNKRDKKYFKFTDDFQDNAMKGKWMVVPTVTDDSSLNTIDKKLIDPDHLDPDDMRRELGF
jgi:hypothetical protein